MLANWTLAKRLVSEMTGYRYMYIICKVQIIKFGCKPPSNAILTISNSTVLLIIQSIMFKSKRREMLHPCLMPAFMSNHLPTGILGSLYQARLAL